MNRISNTFNPVLVTDIDDLRIRSMLDMGFVTEFSTTPEIHAHSCFELLSVMEGELQLVLSDGTALCVREGELCLIPPMVYHSTSSNAVKKLALRFSCEQISNVTEHTSLFDACCPLLFHHRSVTVLSKGATLCEILKDLRLEMTVSQLAKSTYLQALLTQFYIALFRMLSSTENRTKEQNQQSENEQELRRLRIEEYFFEHGHEPIIEDDLAQYMNLSRRQVSRILQQIYGMSFRQLLIDIRLHRAEQLLLTTDFPIEKIAEMIGYASLSGFYTAFHQKFKTSAGQYRLNRKEKA